MLKAARKEEVRRGVREGQKVWNKCEGAGGKGFEGRTKVCVQCAIKGSRTVADRVSVEVDGVWRSFGES